MSSFKHYERVRYTCNCKAEKPLGDLFFCHFCRKTRCETCVQYEIDYYTCKQCYSNLPSTEARSNNYTCKQCHLCPRCANVLIEVSSKIGAPSSIPTSAGEETDASGFQRSTYLRCTSCDWTTRMVDLKDAVDRNHQWSLPSHPVNSNVARFFNGSFEYYRDVANIEKENQTRIQKRQKHPTFYSTHYNIPEVLRLKRIHVAGADNKLDKLEEERGQAYECPFTNKFDDDLPDSLFEGAPRNIHKVSLLAQRHLVPHNQSARTKSLHPIKAPLKIQTILRCKECDHIVQRFEATTSGRVKFKIQNFASSAMPAIVLFRPPVIDEKADFPLHLLVVNKTYFDLPFILLPDASTIEDGQCVALTLPDQEMQLARKSVDSTSSLPETVGSIAELKYGNYVQDDTSLPNAVGQFFLRSNKMGVRLMARLKDAVELDKPLYAPMLLKYTYVPPKNLTQLACGEEVQQVPADITIAIRIQVN